MTKKTSRRFGIPSVNAHLATALLLCQFGLASPAQSDVGECHYSRVLPNFADATFWPNKAGHHQTVHAQLEVNATLFRRGKHGHIINELAQEVTVDNDRDVMTVRLDRSCNWSDGTQISAQDVVAGIQLIYDDNALEIWSPGRESLLNGKEIVDGVADVTDLGIRAIDDATLEFDLIVPPRVLQHALTYVTMTPAPLHIMAENPAAWPTPSLLRVASGPFKAVTQSDNMITFDRNPHYCAGFSGNIDKITLHGRQGRRGSVLMLLGGQSDIAEQVSSTQLSAINFDENDLIVEETPEEILAFLVLSATTDKLANPEIRQAIVYGIDRDFLNSQVSGGERHSRVMNSVSFDYEGYERATLDPALFGPFTERQLLARQIMEKHGYSAQNPLELSFGFPSSQPYDQIALAISSMLGGIHVRTENNILRRRSERKKMDISIDGWGSDFPDPGNVVVGVIDTLSKEYVDRAVAANSIRDNDARLTALNTEAQAVLDAYHILPLVELTGSWVYSQDIAFLDEHYPLGRNASRISCR